VTSKTAMLRFVKAWRGRDALAALDATPALADYRDARGRNWLHVCCGVDVRRHRKLGVRDGIELADGLLARDFGIDAPAFTEGNWKATPLWYSIARGRNLPLARFLLERGADPDHCLWAAGFNNDLDAIRLLVDHGAPIDAVVEDATPLLEAVKWSHFDAAWCLLGLGANADFQDSKGMTALHYMLKKNSDPAQIRRLVDHGVRGDLPNRDGVTTFELLSRKRAPALRALTGRLLNR
jgi:uncharacterized protein